MTYESRQNKSQEEFMHSPGAIFAAKGVLHRLKDIRIVVTPANFDGEMYTPVCESEEFSSFVIPPDFLWKADFVLSLKEGENKGAAICGTCFANYEKGSHTEDPAISDEDPSKADLEGHLVGSGWRIYL
jgi:hypothetical protein